MFIGKNCENNIFFFLELMNLSCLRESLVSEEMNGVVKYLKNFLVLDIYFSKVYKEIRLIIGSLKYLVVIFCVF